jgi:hypothetical protein
MVIVSTREFRDKQKKYFDLATEEQVLIKRGKNYFHLVVSEKPDNKFISKSWFNKFMSIPAEYRVNPFDVSPSGDLFFADKRNLEHIDKARNGQTKTLSHKERKELFSL